MTDQSFARFSLFCISNWLFRNLSRMREFERTAIEELASVPLTVRDSEVEELISRETNQGYQRSKRPLTAKICSGRAVCEHAMQQQPERAGSAQGPHGGQIWTERK